MKSGIRLRTVASSILCGALLLALPLNAGAEDLSGKVGHKRYPVQFPLSETKACEDGYKDYVAASGHSAYAQTPISDTVEGYFCGIHFNAPSKEVAEQEALKNCRSLSKKYKYKTVNNCQIYASK